MSTNPNTRMDFSIDKSLEVLEKTPQVVSSLLTGLTDEWINNNEGADTFSPFDVMGHLVHGEHTDWPARIKKIMGDGGNNAFDNFDRFAMYEESKGKSLDTLLKEFQDLRTANLDLVRSYQLDEEKLNKIGIHPKFGEVTLRQLLSTWTAHDLGHIAQICRVMAKQYTDNVGPWIEYLRILRI